MSNLNWQYSKVYIKTLWSDVWEYASDIVPLNIEVSAAPEYCRANLLWQYGKRNTYSNPIMQKYDPAELNDKFVQITAITATGEVELFTGIIQTDSSLLAGEVYDPVTLSYISTGNQTFVAYDMSYFLDRYTYSGTYVMNGSSTTLNHISHVPTMNMSDGYGGVVIGNRSNQADANGYYRFGTDDEVWSHYEFLRTVINDISPIPVTFVGQTAELDKIKTVQNLGGQTVRSILNQLVQARYGFGWCVMPIGDLPGAALPIRIFTVMSDDLTVGNITIAKNDTIRTVYLDPQGNVNSDINITESLESRWDAIRVEGERMVACSTFPLVDMDDGWSTESEAEYIAGASVEDSNYESYDDDQKATINDAYRSTDKFDDVYRFFKMPEDWDWFINSNNLNLSTGSDGTLIPNVPVGYYNRGKQFTNFIPHLSASGDKYRTPFAVVEHDGKYYYLDRVSESLVDVNGTPYRNIGLSMSPKSLGFEFAARPNHLLAKDWFGETAEISAHTPQFNPYDIKVTAAVRTDHRISVTTINRTPINSVLTIRVPNAELWYIAKGTILDVYGDGTLKQSGVTVTGKPAPESTDDYWVTRNDKDMLQSVATAAKAWYGTARNLIEYTLEYLTSDAYPGVMLTAAVVGSQYTDINTLITKVSYDCRSSKCTVHTQYEDIDFNSLLGNGGYVGSTGTVGNIQSEIEAIKERIAHIPVRQGEGGSGSGSGGGVKPNIRCVVPVEQPQADGTISVIDVLPTLSAMVSATPYDIYLFGNKQGATLSALANSYGLSSFTPFTQTALSGTMAGTTLMQAEKVSFPAGDDFYVCVQPLFAQTQECPE